MQENPPDLLMNINGVIMSGLKPIQRDVIVNVAGNAVFNLTEDNTTNGAPLFNNVRMKIFQGVEVDAAFAFGLPVLSVDKKTLTVPVKKTGNNVNVLGVGIALGALINANGSTVTGFFVGD